MTHKSPIKVLVTGAAGQIGYALLFRLASGQVFGMNTELELHLLEIEPGLPRLRGVVMELEDGAFPLLKNIVCTADYKQAMKDVNWAILVGAAPRQKGMERSDLLQANANIFVQQGAALNQYAASDVRIFVVGNPCNTNALITMHHAPDIPRDRFYAMTALDELRARFQLAHKAGVHVNDVGNMIIWGNHSATQYPDFYHATVGGKAAIEVIRDETWMQQDFIKTVQQRGAQIIQARGASSAASAANAIIYGVQCLTEQFGGRVFSMVVCSSGQYGVDEGLLCSFPCRMHSGKWHVVDGLTHHSFAQEKIYASVDELRRERDTVRDLGLLK